MDRSRHGTPALAALVAVSALVGCSDRLTALPEQTLPPNTASIEETTSSTEPLPATTLPVIATEASSTIAAEPVPASVTTAPVLATAAPTMPTEPAVTASAPTAAPTTTTEPIVAGAAVPCSPNDLAAGTGMWVGSLSCRGGWATALALPCESGVPTCTERELFHLMSDGTTARWQHVGQVDTACAENLVGFGMTWGAASWLAPVCDAAAVPAGSNIPPGSQDARVPALQVALVALGYPVAVDGSYGPRTEAAVRDFQSRVGLDPDGIAGPRTQAALGI